MRNWWSHWPNATEKMQMPQSKGQRSYFVDFAKFSSRGFSKVIVNYVSRCTNFIQHINKILILKKCQEWVSNLQVR